jgi:hypothetical protein
MVSIAGDVATSGETFEHYIRGAAYFVIHTPEESIMYRARMPTYYSAPNFYKMRLPGFTTEVSVQETFHQAGYFITFHDSDTNLIESKQVMPTFDMKQYGKSLLDPAVKVYAYKACLYPRLDRLKVYDKRGHPIAEIPVAYHENILFDDYKELIRPYADPSKLTAFHYHWKREPTGCGALIMSYKNIPR